MPKPHRPFRRVFLRGLAVVLPPLLTVVIFIWVGSTIQSYILAPVTGGARYVLARSLADVREDPPDGSKSLGDGVYVAPDGVKFKRMTNGDCVPNDVYNVVRTNLGGQAMPVSGAAVYNRYVEVKYLQPYVVIPLSIVVFVALMYLLGRFLAAGIGRVFWNLFERGINRLPLVSSVYSSVKQVTDFMFSETEFAYTRIVAVEYPRKGIWSIGFVTGESLLDITQAAGEPIVAVLIPTSPAPVTGYTVNVLKREVVDLNITLDQAFQYIVSCGVVVPPHQLNTLRERPRELAAAGSGARALTSSAGDDD